MLPIDFDAITFADVQALVTNGVSEGQRLDYKLMLPPSSENSDIAADVAAFANTLGGDLIYGVSEKEGVAVAVPGLVGVDIDAAIRRLESILQSSIEPRIPGVRIRKIHGGPAPVLLVRIPRSWWGVHMVRVKGLQRFVGRNNGGNFDLNVYQIRAGFLSGVDILDRARAFRDQRIDELRNDGPPYRVTFSPAAVVHIVPAASLGAPIPIDLDAAMRSGLILALYPTGSNIVFNADGVFALSDGGHTTLYRSGIVESASAALTRYDPVSADEFAKAVIGALDRYLKLSKRLGLSPVPLFVLATLYGLKGIHVKASDGTGLGSQGMFDREVLQLPEVVIENVDIDPRTVLKPVFDTLWNVAGQPQCALFDKAGNWTARW